MPDDLGKTGLLGELEFEMQLVRKGWHVVRLDTARMASNADLLAIKGKSRISIQVKATNAEKEHAHSKFLQVGYSTNYLNRQNISDALNDYYIFNSKKSPLIADVVVCVSYNPNKSRFVVMPVAFAEKLAQYHCDWWKSVEMRDKTKERSDSFPIYMNFFAERKTHAVEHEKSRRNLETYENKWDVLDKSIEELHNLKLWPLID